MHSRTAVGFALAASVGLLAARADAQDVRERVRVERRAPADARALADAARNYSYMTMTRRARLGVTVDLTAREDDRYGATIDAVTPGGAAAKAGLRAGDVITALDGKPLTSGELPRSAADGSSIPGLRLVELAAKLGGGDTVDVAYRRDGAARTTRLITNTDDESARVFGFTMPEPPAPRAAGAPLRALLRRPPNAPMPPEMRGIAPEMIRDIEVIKDGDGPARIIMGLRGGLGDLELAPLNSDLGRYFGTTDGVLVISTAKDEGLGLKGGDVVLAVDGRKVTSPSQLQRILRTYESGEAMKLEIQRDRKRETLNVKMPAPKKMSWTYQLDGTAKQDEEE